MPHRLLVKNCRVDAGVGAYLSAPLKNGGVLRHTPNNLPLLQVTAEQYDDLIATPNTNKADTDVIEARSVGEALSALRVADDQEEDRHPER